ncbi:HpcH/HpaI aldolase family protein [Rhizorhabdus wittichii]|jgi:4-hydroxy-2-oxoheptanedioate aldolase|uniref:HpcH/HpaI aldolase family protein n=1 Tax=Rhizorhabdus wittichii TaxID=160791 RepID=UPI0002ED85F9|nr:aldolase/citrate lyase family protein [Rhizorhabdus wittichii]
MAPRCAIWLSTPNTAAAEIARDLGYTAAVLDIEHGAFDLAALESFIPFLKAIGLEVLAKVLGPDQVPIQQALDFGADAVIIPHIKGVEHARAVTAFAKFPPLGDRSFAGGRTSAYGGFDQLWVERQDSSTKCYPMIEDAGAFEEIEEILALPTVDGVFLGPSDLSLRRGRGAYQRTEGDFADFGVVAASAARAGKPWIIPAWSLSEKQFAVENGAGLIVLTMEHSALLNGMRSSLEEVTSFVTEAAR